MRSRNGLQGVLVEAFQVGVRQYLGSSALYCFTVTEQQQEAVAEAAGKINVMHDKQQCLVVVLRLLL